MVPFVEIFEHFVELKIPKNIDHKTTLNIELTSLHDTFFSLYDNKNHLLLDSHAVYHNSASIGTYEVKAGSSYFLKIIA